MGRMGRMQNSQELIIKSKQSFAKALRFCILAPVSKKVFKFTQFIPQNTINFPPGHNDFARGQTGIHRWHLSDCDRKMPRLVSALSNLM